MRGMAILITDEIIERAIDISKRHGVSRLVLFGSALEHPETAKDLDLACEGLNDWRFFRFAAELEEELKVPIDLFPIENSDFGNHIKKIGKVLYEQVRHS